MGNIGTGGKGADDLPRIYREEFIHAIELVRAQHNPETHWDAFVEALWAALVPAFGLDVAITRNEGYPAGS